MDIAFKEFLFSKHIFVADDGATGDYCVETLVALSHLFGIEITRGAELAQPDMIHLAHIQLGEKVPKPFYKGFPESVRELTGNQLLFDQIIHYTRTYGLGDFTRPGHSLIERGYSGRELLNAMLGELTGEADLDAMLQPRKLARKLMKEKGEVRNYRILTEAEALPLLEEAIDALLSSTRPLNREQTDLLVRFVSQYGKEVTACGCKQTAFALLMQTRDLRYARPIRLSDVIDLAEEIDDDSGLPLVTERAREMAYRGRWRLNLRNRDRRLVAAVIDSKLPATDAEIRACYACRTEWCGLLHHIHYRPASPAAEAFVRGMRGGKNRSPESEFERTLTNDGPAAAARVLLNSRGPNAVLRRLDYLLSRCCDYDGQDWTDNPPPRLAEMLKLLEELELNNALVLIQLLIRYARDTGEDRRCFRFTFRYQLCVHNETPEEAQRRRSHVPEVVRRHVSELLTRRLGALLAGRLGRVYVDPAMKRVGLPLQETASMSGVGALPRGSRLPLDGRKTVRGFTWWQLVNDIDLSVIGLTEDGAQLEFSWRTIHARRDDSEEAPILYSGDQTSGYKGGSEYFDVDMPAFKRIYPDIRYLVFCDNIFSSDIGFDDCDCRAGYMLREEPNSGEVYEPRTVASSLKVRGKGRYAFLFALDLRRDEFIWLNILSATSAAIAGRTSLYFLLDVLRVTDVINVHDFFAMMATELVDDPALADVAVTDAPFEAGEGAEVIHSWDIEKMLKYLNL